MVAPFVEKQTILIVDDEFLVRRVLGEGLRRSGYAIEFATSGGEALRRLRNPGIDLLLLDLQLGDVNGVEVMRVARQAWPEMPVLMLTAHGSLPSAIEAVRCGAVDYLLKPIALDELRERVGSALERAKATVARERQLRDIFSQMQVVFGEQEVPASQPAPAAQPTITVYDSGPLRIDIEQHTVAFEGRAVDVTPSEFIILQELVMRPGAVIACGQLVQALGTPTDDEEEARQLIRPHIVRLRRKVEPDPQCPRHLLAVRSLGYRWAAE